MLSCEFYEVFKNIYERVLLRFLWCFLESFLAAGYLSLMVMMVVIMMMMILFKFDIESFKTIFKNTFFYKKSPVAAFKTRHQKTREMPTEINRNHQQTPVIQLVKKRTPPMVFYENWCRFSEVSFLKIISRKPRNKALTVILLSYLNFGMILRKDVRHPSCAT